MADATTQTEDYAYSSSDVKVTITAGIEYPPGALISEVFLSSDKKNGKPIPGSESLQPKGPEEDSANEIQVEGKSVKKKKRTWEGVYVLKELVGIEAGEKFQVWYNIDSKGPFLLEAAKIKTESEKQLTENITSTGVLADIETVLDSTGVYGTISAKATKESKVAYLPRVSIQLIPKEFFAQFEETGQTSEDYLKGYNIYRFPSEEEANKAFSEDKLTVQKVKKQYRINPELVPYYTKDLKDHSKFNKLDSLGGLVDENGEPWYTDIYMDKNLPPIPPGGRTFYYLVTAVDESGNESDFSSFAIDSGPEPKSIGIFVRKDTEPPAQIKKIDFDLSVPNSIGLYWTDHLDYPKVKNVFATYDRVTRTVSVVWDTTEEPMSDSLLGNLTRNQDFDLLDVGIGKIKDQPLFEFGSFDDSQLYQLGNSLKEKTGFNDVAALKNALIDVCNKTGSIHPAFLLSIMKYVPPPSGEEYQFRSDFGYDDETQDKDFKGLMKIKIGHPQFKSFLEIIKSGQFSSGAGLEFFDNGVAEEYYLERKTEDQYIKNPFFAMMMAGLFLWGIKDSSEYKKKHYPSEKITEDEKDYFFKNYLDLMGIKEV